jgi:hypothetical protein
MEAIRYSETSGDVQKTSQRFIQEYKTPHESPLSESQILQNKFRLRANNASCIQEIKNGALSFSLCLYFVFKETVPTIILPP